ncbi:MAG: cytochrome c [Rhodothermales bacterium]|nr:cytochrome c [Rhodothermales bacterium]
MKFIIAAFALLLASFVLMGQSVDPDPVAEGEVVFKTVCATCHSLDPPPNLAPPMRMVIKHYLEAELEDPWQSMRDWVGSPDAARSALPAHAIERFGVMPPLLLEEADLDALMMYLKTQADSVKTMNHEMGQGMQHGNGQGMQHGNGQGMKHGNGQGMQRRGN